MAVYCTSADLYQAFGEANINRWADLDNEGDITTIAARITWAIALACEYIDSKLVTGHYVVPFTTVPKLVVHLNALYAGILLYDARLIVDTDKDQVSRQRKTFNNWIRQIQRGQLKLVDTSGAPLTVQDLQYPTVDESEEETEETYDIDFGVL